MLSLGFSEYGTPVQNGSAADLAYGPDGNLWFVDKNNAVDKLTPAGVVTSYPLPTAATYATGAAAITVGSDGNLWFTNSALGKVGRITTSGTITMFPVLSTGAVSITDITAGQAGMLWFANGTQIGSITTSGFVTLYNLSGHNIAGGMAEGPDGNLWYVGAGEIDRMSPTGAVTSYALPTNLGGLAATSGESTFAEAMSFNPAGQLLFTFGVSGGAATSSGVGTFDLKGNFSTLFVEPSLNDFGTSVVTATDGTTWETTQNEILRYGPGGVAHYSPVTAGSQPTEIINGPYGFLNYATTNTGDIGQVIPTSQSPPPSLSVRYAIGSIHESWVGQVVGFTDTNPGVTVGDLKAVISWGTYASGGGFNIASQQPGTVVADGKGGYNVYGSQPLSTNLGYVVTIYDTHASPLGLGSVITFGGQVSTANQPVVTAAPVSGAYASDVSLTPTYVNSPGPVTGLDANFGFPGPISQNPVGAITATINWGDGVTSTGAVTIITAANITTTTVNVVGTHSYAKAGTYLVKVTILGSSPSVSVLGIEDGLFTTS